MKNHFMQPSILNLTTSARYYIRFTLLASFAYSEGANEAGEILDKEAADCIRGVWSDSEFNHALASYNDMYGQWRDSGFSASFLVNQLDYLVNAH